ncbi:glycosyltransferase family 9 protein [Gayadomonas joobiniege]|uniref:glycosyltransferase family 9 protein n=1 Tax=Gayadomonas joobiniege TaxID=1234606 RepID=UPI000370ECFC|nr:glycosyltransferase family 9 protein [Gayadomonas joobiniege]
MKHSDIQSICILRLSAIGDVCHALASVQAIQQCYPQAEITWVVGKVEYALLKSIPGIKFVIFDKKQGLAAYKQLRHQLPQKFDVLLHMQVALRANLAALCIRAKRKIGFAKNLSKELHSLVVTEHCQMPERPHVLEGFAAFARAIGVEALPPRWTFEVAEKDRNWVANYIKEGQHTLLIAAAASKAERNWTVTGYAQVADYAVAKGFQVILTGGPSVTEKELSKEIQAAAKQPVINLTGQSNLTQLLALIEAADVVLAPDTGPAHMATTQQTPVIGLYAHSNPARTGPYNSLHYVVSVYEQAVKQQYKKDAKQLKWGTRAKGEDLMQMIEVSDVIEVFDKLIVEQRLNHA